MKPYRRNWIIGIAIVLVGVLLLITNEPGFVKTVAGYVIGAGILLAGWSGRTWVFEEKQRKLTNLLSL